MTQNNTAAAQATEIKAPTKAQLAIAIFREIYAQGYKLSEGCKSQRAEFIKRAQAEAGLTKHGAATYFQNFTNEAKGEGRYKYGTKKAAEASTTESASQANAAADANMGPSEDSDKNEIGQHRWMVVNAAGEEIGSYPARDKAKAAAKAAGLEWKDRNDAE